MHSFKVFVAIALLVVAQVQSAPRPKALENAVGGTLNPGTSTDGTISTAEVEGKDPNETPGKNPKKKKFETPEEEGNDSEKGNNDSNGTPGENREKNRKNPDTEAADTPTDEKLGKNRNQRITIKITDDQLSKIIDVFQSLIARLTPEEGGLGGGVIPGGDGGVFPGEDGEVIPGGDLGGGEVIPGGDLGDEVIPGGDLGGGEVIPGGDLGGGEVIPGGDLGGEVEPAIPAFPNPNQRLTPKPASSDPDAEPDAEPEAEPASSDPAFPEGEPEGGDSLGEGKPELP